MNSIYENLGGTYILGSDGMLYPNLTLETNEHRPIGRWGRMHRTYLEKEHPGLYERLILNDTLHTHLADANERAEAMMELLTEQMKKQEGITEQMKSDDPLLWTASMNSIRDRAEEIVMEEVGIKVPIHYGGEYKGWKGDVHKYSYDVSRLRLMGWTPKYTAEQAIRKAVKDNMNNINN